MFLHHTITSEIARPSFERPIDLVHLARQTLGDRALEREILDLFVVQARAVLAQLQLAEGERGRMELAHTLKGSARAVGAWRVAAAAEACELAVAEPAATWSDVYASIAASVEEACRTIADVQRTH